MNVVTLPANNNWASDLHRDLLSRTEETLDALTFNDDADGFVVDLGKTCLRKKTIDPRFNLPEWTRIEAIFQNTVLPAAQAKTEEMLSDVSEANALMRDEEMSISASIEQRVDRLRTEPLSPVLTRLQQFINDPVQIFNRPYLYDESDADSITHSTLLRSMRLQDIGTIDDDSAYAVFLLQRWWIDKKMDNSDFTFSLNARTQEQFQRIVLNSVTTVAKGMIEEIDRPPPQEPVDVQTDDELLKFDWAMACYDSIQRNRSEKMDFLHNVEQNPMTLFSTPLAPFEHQGAQAAENLLRLVTQLSELKKPT